MTGIKDCHTFLLGTQGENMDHVRRTLDFVAELNPYSAILTVWCDDYESLDPALADKRRAFKETILQELNTLKDMYPRWVIPALNVNFNEKLFKFMRHRGIKGPLWRLLDNFTME
jgi:hypothetical protein